MNLLTNSKISLPERLIGCTVEIQQDYQDSEGETVTTETLFLTVKEEKNGVITGAFVRPLQGLLTFERKNIFSCVEHEPVKIKKAEDK